MFAGLLMEGSVVGYESNLTSGGSGARYLRYWGIKKIPKRYSNCLATYHFGINGENSARSASH